MTAPTPLTAHEELDLLDEIERALVRLTTADLEQGDTMVAPRSSALPDSSQTAILSNTSE